MTPSFPSVAIVSPELTAPVAPTATATATATAGTVPLSGPTFADVLTERSAAVMQPQFSRHALERVQRRGLPLDADTLQRLGNGMQRASSKGARNAVVFVDNTAFVANVPSNTVITAVGSEHMREHVFTNIDSAVIA